MNQLGAMRETIQLMDAKIDSILNIGFFRTAVHRLDESCRPEHLREMLVVMESGVNPQDPTSGFSEAKLGRWLGWAQCAVVAMGLATLDEMKDLNRKYSD